MQQEDKSPRGTIRIYACGGAGINIARHFEKYRNNPSEGFASIEVTYVDTSDSNLRRSNVQSKDVYLIDGLDGSGKVRSENAQRISERVLAILQNHRPADLNVVVGSAAGGSGSVIGPMLASQLLVDKAPVVVFLVGSTDSKIEIGNTLKTIKSYAGVSQSRQAALVAYYLANTLSRTRDVVDHEIHSAISMMAVLFSRQNDELDSSDLGKFLRFDQVTSFPPQLAALCLASPQDMNSVKSVGNIISVATVGSRARPETALDPKPEYQCVGYADPDNLRQQADHLPMHFIVCDGIFSAVSAELTTMLADIERAQQARVPTRQVLSASDKPDDKGMVF